MRLRMGTMRALGSVNFGRVAVAAARYAGIVLCCLGWSAVDAAELESACPGAVTWTEAHREQLAEAMQARDAARTVTNPELRQELQKRFEADQQSREDYLASPHDPVVVRRMDELDAKNLEWLRKLLRGRGVPTADQVGESGVKWTWALVQHAGLDPKLQASTLPLFVKRYEAGEIAGDDVAKLTDRILIAQGKPQRFGTQFNWLSGQFEHRSATEVAQIDAYRRQLGLMPISDYACMMSMRLKKMTSRGEP